MHGPMDRVPTTTTCRCGYASPATLPRCLGCGRRFGRCAHVPVAPAPAPAPASRPRPRQVAPVPRPVAVEAASFSGRDAERFGAPPTATAEPGLVLPTGPLAVLGLVAAAWIGPEGPRPELLTAAAVLGAGVALVRPPAASASPASPAPPPALVLPSRLTDDELREAIAAW